MLTNTTDATVVPVVEDNQPLQQQPNIPALGEDSPGAGILAWAIPPQRLLQNRHTTAPF